MTIEASNVVKGGLLIEDKTYAGLNADGMHLRWRAWYPPTYEDRQYEAQALQLNLASGAMSRESAVAALAPTYDIEDVASELAAIEKDQKDDLDRQVTLAKATKPPKPPGGDDQ